jgi:hypothetical protein
MRRANELLERVEAVEHDRLKMMLFRGERTDGGTQIRKAVDQAEAADLQSARTAVLGLQKDRRGKFATDRRLADTFLAMDQNPRRQLCGKFANVGEVHDEIP